MRYTQTASGRRQLDLLDVPDWRAFDRFADEIAKAFHGKQGQRVEDSVTLEFCYQDIETRGGRVTLHLQHYLGICVFAAEERADGVVENIGNYLAAGQEQRTQP
jgi:hypothetical protein